MKIGIMTFWWSEDNYGQLLQCYALQKYLRDKGHDAYLIRYNFKDDVKTFFLKKVIKAFNPYYLFNYVRNQINKKILMQEQKKHDRGFNEFRKKYIKQSENVYTSYKQLASNYPEADAYVVGSDQIWNFNWAKFSKIKNIIHSYMLDFGDNSTKRISYAASWSVKSLSKEVINEIKPLLKRFDYVSVREQNGIELCAQCGYKNAEWVPDPTMLLEANIYRGLYSENAIRKPNSNYLLLYMLNNQHDFDIQKVYDFAKEKKLKVIYITGNGVVDNREKIFATIPEWLYLVDNAEYVITNSFHCGVFSMLFDKHFGIVSLTGKHEGMNERFISLFEKCNIKSRFLQKDSFATLDLKKDYSGINTKATFLDFIS